MLKINFFLHREKIENKIVCFLFFLLILPILSDDYRIKHPKTNAQKDSEKRRANELKNFKDKKEQIQREKEEAPTRHKTYRPEILKHEMKFHFLKDGKVNFKEYFKIRLKQKYHSVYVRDIKFKSDSLVQDWRVTSLQLEGNNQYKADFLENKVEINFKEPGANIHEFTLNYLLEKPYTFLNKEAIFFWKSYEEIANDKTKISLEFEKGLAPKFEVTTLQSNSEFELGLIENKIEFKQPKGFFQAEISKADDSIVLTNFYINIGIPTFLKEPALPEKVDGVFSIEANLKLEEDTEILSKIKYNFKSNGNYSQINRRLDLPNNFDSFAEYFGESYSYIGGNSLSSIWNEKLILHLPENAFTVNSDYSLTEIENKNSNDILFLYKTIGQFVKKELFTENKILYLYTDRPNMDKTYLAKILYRVEFPSVKHLNQLSIKAYLIEKYDRDIKILQEINPEYHANENILEIHHSDLVNLNQTVLYRLELPESKFSSPSLFKKLKYILNNVFIF